MASLYPPILASTQITQPEAASEFKLYFTMPGFNSKAAILNGHSELSVRIKKTNKGAILDDYSPNYSSVYFFNNSVKEGEAEVERLARIEEFDADNNTWRVCFSKSLLDPSLISVGTELVVQLRFGDREVPKGIYDKSSSPFADWYNAQVNEQAIGEWSNSIAMYLYGEHQTRCTDYTLVYRNFIPEGKLGYCSNENDPPVRITMKYTYQAPNGESTYTKSEEILVEPKPTNKDELFSKNNTTTEFGANYKYYWAVPWKLNIFPNQAEENPIKMTFEGITEKGVHFGTTGGVNQRKYTDYLLKFLSDPYYLQSFNNTDIASKEDCLQVQVVTGEEIDDGVIVKLIKNTNNILDGKSFNVYRVNVNTGEAVTLKTGLQFKSGEDTLLIRDYVIEHGEKFEYVVINFQDKTIDEDSSTSALVAMRSLVPTPLLDPLGYKYSFNPATGRLTDMQYSFLTSRDHQLRLSGNVTLNNISWKTQDTLQTTIGAKFPFYTRNAYTKYRTFQLGAVVSIQLDPTSTFLELTPVEYLNGAGANSKKGGEYWWKTGYGTSKENNYATVEKVLDSDDIIMAHDIQMDKERFGYEQSPKIRNLNKMRWVLKGAKDEQGNPNPSLDSIKYEDAQFGALTAYDGGNRSKEDAPPGPCLHLANSREYTSERTSDMVFLERKYREKVMEWLIDGVPKLFRSPTEGNMIVVLNNISFTPLQHTDRMVYSFSATATEVAEYNLDNLIEYNLVPVMFEANPEDLQSNSPWGFTPGAEDYDLIKVWEENGNNPDSWNPRRPGGDADGNFSKKLFNR